MVSVPSLPHCSMNSAITGIERQLAHGEQDEVRAAYNYAEYLPERRKMMQAWADYLDGLRNTQQKRIREEA